MSELGVIISMIDFNHHKTVKSETQIKPDIWFKHSCFEDEGFKKVGHYKILSQCGLKMIFQNAIDTRSISWRF